ncbi:hypothetical protein OC842_001647 [Tilletia horrida]|uniref:Uncharacterized protein n=1 Tax=Tilletia horrida TaxID=155126 RepID=A0AAN6GHB8_9BASI|nr:hypothetical protein OC842_001647 [Tilletia horrida]
MSDTNTENSTLQNLGGHAQYVKGAAESAIASVTGSSEWAASADQDKQAGVQTIRQASAAAADGSPADGTTTNADDSLAAKACPVAGGGVGQSVSSQ